MKQAASVFFTLVCIVGLAEGYAQAASPGFNGYKVSHNITVKEKNAFDEEVEREKIVVSSETLAGLATKIKKLYGKKVSINRDYSVENMGKLFMTGNEYALLGKYLEKQVWVTMKVPIDFKKFDNSKDLSLLFKSCEQKVDMYCDKQKKVCEYEHYKDELTCTYNGHVFEDIMSRHDSNLRLQMNKELLKKIMEKSFNNDFLHICADEDNSDLQQTTLDKVREILPRTKVLSMKECRD